MSDDDQRRLLAVLEGIREQLDRIEASMLKPEDLHVSNRARPVVTEADKRQAEWEAAQAGEHRPAPGEQPGKLRSYDQVAEAFRKTEDKPSG